VSLDAAALVKCVRFGDDGLAPAIVQDATSGRVLTLAWLNRESLQRTIDEGQTWFWSRSRQELWHKGATSGNTQTVRSIRLDCDGDAVTILVDPAGPACHTGADTCFEQALTGTVEAPFAAIADLTRVIADRANDADQDSSYTARLLAKGIDTVCKKVGEEATEVVLAAKGNEHEGVARESADLLYHLAVLWQATGVDFAEVVAVLDSRRPKAE
jgi:phosphoribosyl-AMP cyclohydrolase / phosphoribosyl-ATP pyrophosphohydrolase